MNAILLAGGEPQRGEPLYQETRGKLKAMIKIEGKPMVQWVLSALDQSQAVKHIVVVGLPFEVPLDYTKPVSVLEDQGNTLRNIRAGVNKVLELDPTASQILLTTAETPAIRPYMVDWLAQQVQNSDFDICYTIIEQSKMKTLFPAAKKTYIYLKDLAICSGYLFCIKPSLILQNHPIWDRIKDASQSTLRQATLLGFDALFILKLRLMDLHQAQEEVNKRLGINGRALLCPYAEPGLNVSKPAHLEIMRNYLAHNQAGTQIQSKDYLS